MNDELAARFLSIHADYRSAISAAVRNLSDEDLENTKNTYAAKNLHAIPFEMGLVAVAVRRAAKYEQKRRAAEAALWKETEA